jgi:hypothetical protein
MSHMKSTGAVFLVFFLSVGNFSTGADAAPLAAHRAFYDFKIDRNDRNSGYEDATGRLAYEVTGSACEGWAISYRFASRYVQAEGNIRLTDSQLTSWESGDGSEMRLNQKYYVDNALDNESKIVANRKAPNGPFAGQLTLPTVKDFALTADTLFPMTYQSFLLSDAASGKPRSVSHVYEGTDGPNAYRVITIIGKQKATTASSVDTKAPDAILKGMPAWPMSTSYFPDVDDKSTQPLYQSHYTMYANGVTSDLLFDYGSYTLKGALVKLEMITAPPCN